MAETGELSEEVLNLIRSYLDSLEAFEVLLLLRAGSETEWTPRSVNESIRSSMTSVQHRLETLRDLGFLAFHAERSTYQYSPVAPELVVAVNKLADAYREKRLKFIEALFSKPLRDIGSFSDAFILRGKKPNG